MQVQNYFPDRLIHLLFQVAFTDQLVNSKLTHLINRWKLLSLLSHRHRYFWSGKGPVLRSSLKVSSHILPPPAPAYHNKMLCLWQQVLLIFLFYRQENCIEEIKCNVTQLISDSTKIRTQAAKYQSPLFYLLCYNLLLDMLYFFNLLINIRTEGNHKINKNKTL